MILRIGDNLTKNRTNTFIDLFAGCGGLSLGLESAGFDLLLYNELNQSAASTYYINHKIDVDSGKIKFIADVKDVAGFNYNGVDLICGGPPCQGFSGIGHRRSHNADRENMQKNKLYLEMVRIVKEARPKLFLFENVRGLLSASWTRSNNSRGEIFNDILDTFHNQLGKEYDIRWEVIRCSGYGIPQNRPRVFIIGIQKGIFLTKKRDFLEIKKNGFGINDGFFPKPFKISPPNLRELLSDLIDDGYEKNGYSTLVYPSEPKSEIQKVLRKKKNYEGYSRKGDRLTEQVYSKHRVETIERFKYMQAHNGQLGRYKTKKFAQRLLPPLWDYKGPTITATSLPDDYVHFSQPRILTVREWARLQTFPDYYEFCGPRTTGGLRRAGFPNSTSAEIDLPKYTQIGNAVPVLLAKQIGEHFLNILGG